MRHRQSSAVASSLPCPQGKRARRLQLDPAEGALADRLEAPRDKSGLSAYYGKLSTAAVTKAGATLSACDALTVGGSSVTVQ